MGAKWTQHIFIGGRTGTGKSNKVGGMVLDWDGPSLIIDRKLGLARELGWPTADFKHQPPDLIAAARDGLCYVPHWDTTVAKSEVDMLIQEIFFAAPHDPAFLLVIDEAWRVAAQGSPAPQVFRAMHEGRAAGIQVVLVTPRCAEIDKDVACQCGLFHLFDTSLEGPWMQRYGIDHAEVTRLLHGGLPWSYVTYDGKSIQGPFQDPLLRS